MPSLQPLLRLRTAIATLLQQAWAAVAGCFLSKDQADRRSATRLRAKLEAERLDRLRNPRDYRGK